MEKRQCDMTTAAFVKTAIEVAEMVGVDSLLFRPQMVSGVGGKTGMSVVMLHNHTHTLAFDVLGVNQPKDLKTRLALIDVTPGSIEMDVVQDKIDDDPTQRDLVSKMTFKKGRMKMTYAASSPKVIKAPRRITFNEVCQIPLDVQSAVSSISSAMRALQIDSESTISLSSMGGELIVTIVDKGNDTFEDMIGPAPTNVSFSHRYVLSYFLSLLRNHDATVPIAVSKEGLLRFSINGFAIFQLPRV